MTLKDQYGRLINSLNDEYKNEYHNYFATINYTIGNVDETFNRIFPNLNFNRQKRGLINGLGSIFKSITGNLDAEDGDRINKALEILANDQNRMHELFKEQTSLMTDAIDEFNNTIVGLVHNQDQILERIHTMEYVVKNVVTSQMSAYSRVHLLELFTQVSNLLNNIESVILTTENAITFSKLKTYHTSILKPKFIINELKIIKDHISNSRLITEDDITLYEKVFEIKTVQSELKIIFQIDIPLIDMSDYTYYQLYSLPVPVGNQIYKLIIPRTKYLILSDKLYAFRNGPCQDLGNQMYFCKEDNPTPIEDSSPCEIKLINFQKPINNCKQEMVKISKSTVSRYGNTQYIIVSPQETKSIIRCEDNEDSKIIQGTYLASLKPRCQLIFNGKKYQSIQITTRNQQTFNLPNIDVPMEEQPISDFKLPELKLENVKLNNIKDIKQQLTAIQVRVPEDIKLPIHHVSIWTILLYIILSITILTVSVKLLWSRYCSRKMEPQSQAEMELPLRISDPANSSLRKGGVTTVQVH